MHLKNAESFIDQIRDKMNSKTVFSLSLCDVCQEHYIHENAIQ